MIQQVTTEQRSRKAEYDRKRKVITSERKRQKRAEQREIDEKFKAAFTKEENMALTRHWWGEP